jgi:non-lysosomal glucosylceramidase
MLLDSFSLFSEYKLWEEEIEKWQNPILKDERLPKWYILYLYCSYIKFVVAPQEIY